MKMNNKIRRLLESKTTILLIECADFVRCKDGELRRTYYEITDDGWFIKYLADKLRDSEDDYIIQELCPCSSGQIKFSVVEAGEFSVVDYTPQVDVGATAAFGAILGGAAGAVIGAATAAQANANAPTYNIPVTYGTGSYRLLCNESISFFVWLFPQGGGQEGTLCRNIGWNTEKMNQWIGGEADAYNGKSKYFGHLPSDTNSMKTQQKRAEFYTKFIEHFCEHPYQVTAALECNWPLSLAKIKHVSGRRYGFMVESSEYKARCNEVQQLAKAAASAYKTNQEILAYNSETARKRKEWIDKESNEERDRFFQQNEKAQNALTAEIEALNKDAEIIATSIQSAAAELGHLGLFCFKKKKELRQIIEQLTGKQDQISKTITAKEQSLNDLIKQKKAYRPNKKQLMISAKKQFKYKKLVIDESAALLEKLYDLYLEGITNSSEADMQTVFLLLWPFAFCASNTTEKIGLLFDAYAKEANVNMSSSNFDFMKHLKKLYQLGVLTQTIVQQEYNNELWSISREVRDSITDAN